MAIKARAAALVFIQLVAFSATVLAQAPPPPEAASPPPPPPSPPPPPPPAETSITITASGNTDNLTVGSITTIIVDFINNLTGGILTTENVPQGATVRARGAVRTNTGRKLQQDPSLQTFGLFSWVNRFFCFNGGVVFFPKIALIAPGQTQAIVRLTFLRWGTYVVQSTFTPFSASQAAQIRARRVRVTTSTRALGTPFVSNTLTYTVLPKGTYRFACTGCVLNGASATTLTCTSCGNPPQVPVPLDLSTCTRFQSLLGVSYNRFTNKLTCGFFGHH